MILLDGQSKAEAPEDQGPKVNSYDAPLGADHLTKPLREIAVGDILWNQKLSDYLVVQEMLITRDPKNSDLFYLRASEGNKSWTFLGTDSRSTGITDRLRSFEHIVVLKDSDALLQRRVGALRREHSLVYGQSSTSSTAVHQVSAPAADSLDLVHGERTFSWKNPRELELWEFVLTNFGWRPVNKTPGRETIVPSNDGTDRWYMRKRVLYNLKTHYSPTGAPHVPVWGPRSTAGDRDPGRLFSQRWVPLAELSPGVQIRSSDGRWREVATVWHPPVRRGLKKSTGHMATVKYQGSYDLPLDLTIAPNLRGESNGDPEILVREELTAAAAKELQKGMTL